MSTLRPLNTTRPDGFYHVKYNGRWTIGERFRGGDWEVFGVADWAMLEDSSLDEIGERIVRRAGPECPRCGGVVPAITDVHECGGEVSGE